MYLRIKTRPSMAILLIVAFHFISIGVNEHWFIDQRKHLQLWKGFCKQFFSKYKRGMSHLLPVCIVIFSKISHFKPTVAIHFNELQRGLQIKFLLLKSKLQKREAFIILIAVSLKGQVEGRRGS